jgi:hypothetical protein
MGLRDVLGREPLAAMRELINSPEENQRRLRARRRLDLYSGNSDSALREEIYRVFQSPIVRQKIEPFIKLAGSTAVYSRIVNEVTKNTYNPAPTRRVTPDRDAEAWRLMADEVRFDRKLDIGARLTKAANATIYYPAYSARSGKVVLHVMTPDQLTVKADPDDPTLPLWLAYETGGDYVYWDDAETFRCNANFEIYPHTHKANEDGFIPFEFIHLGERHGGNFWDWSTGADLEAAHLAVALLNALRIRLHKSQGERVLKAEGNTAGMVSGQVIDAEEVIKVPEGVTLQTLDLATSPAHYMESISDLISTTAANHGVSRDRINASSSGDVAGRASDTALFEQRAEIITVFSEGEQRLFDLMRKVSRYYPDPARRISDEARLEVDYREMESRTSKREQIEIWDLKEARGLMSFVDAVKSENPEMRTDAEAIERFERNMELRAKRIEIERKLNTSGEPGNPGPSPQENGADNEAKDSGLPPGSGVRGAAQGNQPRRGEGT